MIILQAGAKRRRYGQPLADVHGVVVVIVIPPVSKGSRVRPIVLNHVDPQRENAYAKPHHQHKLQIADQLPEEIKTYGLRKYGEDRIRSDAKRPGLQNPVTGQIFLASIRHHAEIEGSPETIAGKFIGIAGMVGMFMMQSVAIHPGDRVHVEPEDVIHDRDGFYEPFLIVERAMRDSQVKKISQIQPAKKPAKDKINSAYQQAHPRAQMSGCGVHTSQRVEQNN